MNAMPDFDPDEFTVNSRATWNESAPRYDKMSAALFAPVAEEFVVFAGLRKGWAALEIACGPGVATRAASRRRGEKGSLLATDFAPERLALAAARPPERRCAPVEFKAMD